MLNTTRSKVEHFVVYQQYDTGGWVTISCTAHDKQVYVNSIHVTGIVDLKMLRFAHKNRLYRIPPLLLETRWSYEDRRKYSCSFELNVRAIPCDNLEYLEWEYERRYRG